MRRGEYGYLDLLDEALHQGEYREDRTGVGCYSLHAPQLRFDLREGFPLLTTKRVSFHNVKHELLWFLSGSTNVQALQAHKVSIWDEWADEHGELGPVYGHQWRRWTGVDFEDAKHDSRPRPRTIDQITALMKGLRKNPNSRRHIVTAWNPLDVDDCGLPPCHCFFQVFYHPKTSNLSLHLYQRSADLFLGVPYNIASYALLLHLICAPLRLQPRELVVSFGDAHVYRNHAAQVRAQLERSPYQLPVLLMAPDARIQLDLHNIDPGWLLLENYRYHSAIKAEVAV